MLEISSFFVFQGNLFFGMIKQAELNRAFFAKYGEPSFLEGMASQAKLFCPKARAKTKPSFGSDPTLQKGSLERHIAKYHPEKRETEEAEKTDNSSHSCSKCEKNFTSLLNYSDHFNQEHERVNNRYQCVACPKDYNSLTNLTMHVKVD